VSSNLGPSDKLRWMLRPVATAAERLLEEVRVGLGQCTWAGLNCTILYVDIAGFGGHDRTDKDRQVIRNAMYAVLKEAFRRSGLSWALCYHEDRGDGVLVVIPPGIPTSAMVDPFLRRLAAGLARHNEAETGVRRIQLRAALHVGPVTKDGEGLAGESLICTARLLDAPVLKDDLARTGADLGFIASTFVYDTVIRHGPGAVEPADYRQVQLAVKESRLCAWMWLSEPELAAAGRISVLPRLPAG
jgi:hypothetical protein